MKLGLHPAMPWNVEAFDPGKLQAVVDLGFTGVGPFIPEVEQLDRGNCAKIGAALQEAGLDLPQVGHYRAELIHSEVEVRQASIESVKRALERAAWMGGASVVVGSGSRNTANAWFDHPKNHSWECFDLVVESLKHIMPTAEEVGVNLSLECHTYTAFDSPERVRDIIDAVGSPRLRVNIDPVNWITYATYWDNGPFLHHMFDLLGDVIDAAHAKDVRQEDGLIIHLNETYAGNGNLNYQVFLACIDELAPGVYLLIEHTPWDLVPTARGYVLSQAKAARVSFVP